MDLCFDPRQVRSEAIGLSGVPAPCGTEARAKVCLGGCWDRAAQARHRFRRSGLVPRRGMERRNGLFGSSVCKKDLK